MEGLKIDYDEKFDTLYVAITDNSKSYGDDGVEGIILLRDVKTDEITGFTILNFWRKIKNDRT